MATDLFNDLETLRPSARNLKDGTNWPDWLIDDYLTLFNNLITISQAVDSETEISDEDVLLINEQLAGLASGLGRLQALISKLQKNELNNIQLIADLQTSVALVQALVNSVTKANLNLQQVTSGVSTSYLLGLIQKQERRILNLEQQVG